MGGWRPGRLVRWCRGQQRHRSRRVSRSHHRVPLADIRFVLRLHPSRRVESEDRTAPVSQPQARQHRHQLRSVDHDLSRRLVLSARHARILLRGRELDLQHPHGTGAESHGPVSRQHGRRHAAGRRKAVPRFERTLHRPGTFRLARAWRRRAEVLVPLRSRPRSGWYQRARHSTAALARRLARGWRQRPRG